MLGVVLVALLAALPLAACGRRGSPVPPETRLPAAVADLGAVIRPGGIVLTWTLPDRRIDHSRLGDLVLERVYRAEDTGTGTPRVALLERGRIRGYDEIAAIRLAMPAPATIEGRRVTLVDRARLATGRRYTYVVLSEDSTGRVSPPSSRATVTFIAAPEPPRGLTAEAGENEARLAWQPPARLADGTPLAGEIVYEVLRRAAPGAPLSVVSTPPVTEPRFADRGLQNEARYEYAVRAVRIEGGTLATSDATTAVTVTPVDMTAPSPPRELTATPSERTARLSWLPSPDADVAAYVIYRGRDGGELLRVGSVAAPTTVFTDRDLPPGRYRYAVTAEDGGSRRNESARSNEVRVSVP
ncbi:MAG: fibronectin type III domain-containing protein [Candidatus Rokubacteria bacterium]|nr:fibronectin type III domain-containing protein [Candidatus Rokubacteria bacterium]